MKDFISLKNVKSVYYFEDREFVSLTISYFNNEEPNKYRKRIEGLEVEQKIYVIERYKETYIKIKNALTNTEDFVEVEV